MSQGFTWWWWWFWVILDYALTKDLQDEYSSSSNSDTNLTYLHDYTL